MPVGMFVPMFLFDIFYLSLILSLMTIHAHHSDAHNPPAATHPHNRLCVWSSSMRRCRHTAQLIACRRLVEWRALREIEVGVCDGLTYEQVKIQFPEEYRARDLDKLRYAWVYCADLRPLLVYAIV